MQSCESESTDGLTPAPGLLEGGELSGLRENYASSGFGNLLGFGSAPALLVVDLVMAYFDRRSGFFARVENILQPCKLVLQAARRSNIPIVYTKVQYSAGGIDGGLFFKKMAPLSAFVGENDLGSIHPAVSPAAGELVIRKQYASAFFGTSLDSTLRSLGIDTLIMVGLTTSGCIRATAVDAIQLGFRPVVLSDAVGDRHPGPHKANLFDLGAKYADVVESGEAVAELTMIGASTSARQGPGITDRGA